MDCIGCGLCEAICHKQAISIGEDHNGSIRFIDKELCIHCGLCDRVCPIDGLKEKDDFDDVKKVIIGKSKNTEVVKTSASGGIVSEVLILLFESKMIDAAIVSFSDNHAHIYGDVIESSDEVQKHSGSYYHTSKQLVNIQKIRKYGTVAVVGLPCQMEGVTKYARLFQIEKKIIKIGIFCTVGRMYEGFRRFVIKETGFDVSKGNVNQYVSRYGEKNFIRIEDQIGNIYEFPDEKYRSEMDFFWSQKVCLDCKKLYALSADISVGDAWHRVKRDGERREKIAIVAANSDIGIDILKQIEGRVYKTDIENERYELIMSQKYGAGLKLANNDRIVKILRLLRKIRGINTVPFIRIVNYMQRDRVLIRLEKITLMLAEETKEQ